MADKIIATIEQGEAESVAYSIEYADYSSVSSPSVTVYRNGSDVTSTVMPSGSHTVSNNVVTMKNLTALNGGDTYIISITVTVTGSQTIQRWIKVYGIRSELGRVRVK